MNGVLAFFIRQQVLLKWLCFVGYLVLVFVWLTGGWALSQQLISLSMLYEIGSKFGTLAVILYTATLIPGILKRLQVLPQFASVGRLYRRQVGITMFLSALVHYSFTTMFPFVIGGQMPVFDVAKTAGFFSLLTLLLLFVTSNDLAERGLGKIWIWLQRLTYVALILIFIHVAFMEVKWAVVLGVTAFFEILSWVVFLRRAK
jgi:DMSO/TMAO reductase YedYZ heme-binding membrane subunit